MNKSRLKLHDSKLLAEELGLCPFFLYKAHIEVSVCVGGLRDTERKRKRERDRGCNSDKNIIKESVAVCRFQRYPAEL